MKSQVSVIIPFNDSLSNLDRCLASLKNQTCALIEIIVVNNSSLSLDHLDSSVVVLEEPVPSSYAARNRGALNAKGNILAFIDSDCEASQNWLTNAVNELECMNENEYIAGSICFPKQETTSALAIYQSLFEFDQQFFAEKLHFSATANLIIRQSDFLKAGLFPLRPVGSDAAWGVMAYGSGLRPIFKSNVMVYHEFRAGLTRHLLKTIKTFESGWRNRKIDHFIHSPQGLKASGFLQSKFGFLLQRFKVIFQQTGLMLKLSLLLILLADVLTQSVLTLVYLNSSLRKLVLNSDIKVRSTHLYQAKE